MEPNQHAPPKTKRGALQLQPILAATLRQARRLTRRHSPAPPATVTPFPQAAATPRPSTPIPSLFLDFLPPEIRARVYHFVFASRELQVFHYVLEAPGMQFDKDKYYVGKICGRVKVRHREIDSDYSGGKWRPSWRENMTGIYINLDDPQHTRLKFRQEPDVKGQLLGLALSCRQVYEESIRFLYGSLGFTLYDSQTLSHFVGNNSLNFMRWVRVMRVEYRFAEPIVPGWVVVHSPPYFQLGDTVDWDETCRCLQMMTRLSLLHVTIYPSDNLVKQHSASDMVWEMLEMLREVRADEFRVSTREPFMKFRDMLTEAPFELCDVHQDY